jgi:hypothetical protein
VQTKASQREPRGFRLSHLVLINVLTLAFVALLAGCSGGNMTNNVDPVAQPAPKSLQVWTNSSNGINFTMVGTDPSQPGASTTTVPVKLIPVAIDFSLVGANLSAEEPACLDNVPIINRVTASPLFANAAWPSGDETQFVDAFQRANFWTIVNAQSPDYHVLLSPFVAPTAFIEAPLDSELINNPNLACLQPLAGIPIDSMNSFVSSRLQVSGLLRAPWPFL